MKYALNNRDSLIQLNERLLLREVSIQECIKMVEPLMPNSKLLSELGLTLTVIQDIRSKLVLG